MVTRLIEIIEDILIFLTLSWFLAFVAHTTVFVAALILAGIFIVGSSFWVASFINPS